MNPFLPSASFTFALKLSKSTTAKCEKCVNELEKTYPTKMGQVMLRLCCVSMIFCTVCDTHCRDRVDRVIKSLLPPSDSFPGEDHFGMPELGFLPSVADPDAMPRPD